MEARHAKKPQQNNQVCSHSLRSVKSQIFQTHLIKIHTSNSRINARKKYNESLKNSLAAQTAELQTSLVILHKLVMHVQHFITTLTVKPLYFKYIKSNN